MDSRTLDKSFKKLYTNYNYGLYNPNSLNEKNMAERNNSSEEGRTPHHTTVDKRLQRVEFGPSRLVTNFAEKYHEMLKPGASLLEVAVGEGRNLEAFADYDLDLHGIDADPEAVKIANEHLKKLGIEAKIEEGNFTDLSRFNDSSMDAVISHAAIHNAFNLDQAQQAIKEISRVLKPGGRYLMCESYTPRIKDADRRVRVAYFTPDEIQEIAKVTGLDIESGFDQPYEVKDNPEWVGGKQIMWNIVFQKPNVESQK